MQYNLSSPVLTAHCLSVRLLVDTFGLLSIMLLQTRGYKYLSKALLSICSGAHLEVELLDRVVILALLFEGLPCCFPPQLRHLRPLSSAGGSSCDPFWKEGPCFLIHTEGTSGLSGGPACMQSPRGQNSRDPVPCPGVSSSPRTPHQQLSARASRDSPTACLRLTTHPLARSLGCVRDIHGGLTQGRALAQVLRTGE